jgi:hypothetical protein
MARPDLVEDRAVIWQRLARRAGLSFNGGTQR